MEDTAFVNSYMDRLMNEVLELTKYRMLTDTKLSYVEGMNVELIKRVEDLSGQLAATQAKLEKRAARGGKPATTFDVDPSMESSTF